MTWAVESIARAPFVFFTIFSAVVGGLVSLRELTSVKLGHTREPAAEHRIRSAGAARLLQLGVRKSVVRRQRRELPQLAGVLARSLRSGASLTQAFSEARDHPAVASFHSDLAQIDAARSNGQAIAEALADWNQRCRVDGLELLVTAMVLGIETGGDRAQVLDRVATTLGDRLALEDEVKALTSQARASAGLITVAPMVLALVFLVIDPGVVEVMVGTVIGRVALCGGIGLAVANWWWMSVIVRRTLP